MVTKRYVGSYLAFNKIVSQDSLLILNVNVIGTGHIIERKLWETVCSEAEQGGLISST